MEIGLDSSSHAFLELAADDARNRSVDRHAVVDEHLDHGLLVALEFSLDHVHVVVVALAGHLLLHQCFFLRAKTR